MCSRRRASVADAAAPPRSGWRRAKPWLKLALALALLAAVAAVVDVGAVAAAWRGADGRWLAAGLACALAANAASAWRWSRLLRAFGHRLPARWWLANYLRGIAVGTLLPGAVVGGDVYRAWAARQAGATLAAAGASVLLDRLSGLWMLFVVAAAGLAGGLVSPAADAVRAALAGGPALLQRPGCWAAVALTVLLLPWPLLRWQRRRGGAGAVLAAPGLLAWQAGSSALVQGLSIAALACAAQAFGVQLALPLLVASAAPIFLVAALPLGHGGWGAREAAAALVWGPLGVAPALAVAVASAYGVFALVQAAIGLPLLLRGPGGWR